MSKLRTFLRLLALIGTLKSQCRQLKSQQTVTDAQLSENPTQLKSKFPKANTEKIIPRKSFKIFCIPTSIMSERRNNNLDTINEEIELLDYEPYSDEEDQNADHNFTTMATYQAGDIRSSPRSQDNDWSLFLESTNIRPHDTSFQTAIESGYDEDDINADHAEHDLDDEDHENEALERPTSPIVMRPNETGNDDTDFNDHTGDRVNVDFAPNQRQKSPEERAVFLTNPDNIRMLRLPRESQIVQRDLDSAEMKKQISIGTFDEVNRYVRKVIERKVENHEYLSFEDFVNILMVCPHVVVGFGACLDCRVIMFEYYTRNIHLLKERGEVSTPQKGLAGVIKLNMALEKNNEDLEKRVETLEKIVDAYRKDRANRGLHPWIEIPSDGSDEPVGVREQFWRNLEKEDEKDEVLKKTFDLKGHEDPDPNKRAYYYKLRNLYVVQDRMKREAELDAIQKEIDAQAEQENVIQLDGAGDTKGIEPEDGPTSTAGIAETTTTMTMATPAPSIATITLTATATTATSVAATPRPSSSQITPANPDVQVTVMSPPKRKRIEAPNDDAAVGSFLSIARKLSDEVEKERRARATGSQPSAMLPRIEPTSNPGPSFLPIQPTRTLGPPFSQRQPTTSSAPIARSNIRYFDAQPEEEVQCLEGFRHPPAVERFPVPPRRDRDQRRTAFLQTRLENNPLPDPTLVIRREHSYQVNPAGSRETVQDLRITQSDRDRIGRTNNVRTNPAINRDTYSDYRTSARDPHDRISSVTLRNGNRIVNHIGGRPSVYVRFRAGGTDREVAFARPAELTDEDIGRRRPPPRGPTPPEVLPFLNSQMSTDLHRRMSETIRYDDNYRNAIQNNYPVRSPFVRTTVETFNAYLDIFERSMIAGDFRDLIPPRNEDGTPNLRRQFISWVEFRDPNGRSMGYLLLWDNTYRELVRQGSLVFTSKDRSHNAFL